MFTYVWNAKASTLVGVDVYARFCGTEYFFLRKRACSDTRMTASALVNIYSDGLWSVLEKNRGWPL